MEHTIRTPHQFGQVLQGIRRGKKLTQQEAGLKVGLLQSAVSEMEKDPSKSSLDRLFRMLSVLELELVVRSKPVTQAQARRSPAW